MDNKQLIIRKSKAEDTEGILKLYQRVSSSSGGIARKSYEITLKYVEYFTLKSIENGLQYLVITPSPDNKIVGEIHTYQLEPSIFCHVLSELTIAVDTNYQGKGFGKLLFQTLLDDVQHHRTDIRRVELLARESNTKAIQFYERLGFKIEGRFEHRVFTMPDQFEADIPMAWFNPNFKLSS